MSELTFKLPEQIVLATNNSKKLKEFNQIFTKLCNTPISFKTLDDFKLDSPIENGATFYENALIKAKYCFEKTGLAAIGDDSGIVVKIMGSAPGIFSARWAGEHHKGKGSEDKLDPCGQLLLEQLSDVKLEDRGAFFQCTIVYYGGENNILTVDGQLDGTIAKEASGTHGFGYDPIFIPQGLNKTIAELVDDEKNQISHRRRAIEKLVEVITCA